MTAVERLDIDRLRNLSRVSIQPSPTLNLITGPNGSGKTSLLEALHILSLGRSFRSSRLEPLIQAGSDSFQLFARFSDGATAGVQKSQDARSRLLKFNGEKQKNWQQLIQVMPVQLFNSDSFALLQGGARVRRTFIDWGVFHVEHGFLPAWQMMSRCLSQRNALLKRGQSRINTQLSGWDEQLVACAERVTASRISYFDRLLPFLHEAVLELLPDIPKIPEFEFYQGWPLEQSYEQALSEALTGDLRYGMTRKGPHRADIRIKAGGLPADQVFSRGQQKMLVCAMKLAEIRSLKVARPTVRPVLLVDDLASELDPVNRQRVLRALSALETQGFYTAIEQEELGDLARLRCGAGEIVDIRQFHVEHGKIQGI